MKDIPFPYKSIVFVCTNVREDRERVSCAGHGRTGAALRDALKDQVAARGLKGIVRVSAAGCLDLCEQGPNVMVFDADGKSHCYARVSESDLPALLDKHFRK